MHHIRPNTSRNLEQVIDSLETRLRSAASPPRITQKRVRAFCSETNNRHWRFERVLLLESFKVLDADDLIRRLMSDLRRRLRAGTNRVSPIGEPSLAYLATLLQSGSSPAFLGLERVVRLGRLSQQRRVYLLYWRRLRDYLLWFAASSEG
jgi:hypothetical protein